MRWGGVTYNADHMSMYGVNSGVPKTLVRWVIQTATENPAFAASKDVLQSILDTPISPELLPPDEQGNVAQQTEDLVGPYALHDFFLYYAVRFGMRPRKIYELAKLAFAEDFDDATILKWLKNFYRRFFTQQFKRNWHSGRREDRLHCVEPPRRLADALGCGKRIVAEGVRGSCKPGNSGDTEKMQFLYAAFS